MFNLSKYLFLLAIFILFNSPATAEQWALRARENYEVNRFSDVSGDYKGLTSSLSLFREEPYKFSYGLGINLPISLLKNKTASPILGSEMRSWAVGGEIKYFPVEDVKGFLRSTMSYQHNSFKGTIGSASGVSLYLGAGWEFPVWLISLAPEVGYRHSALNHSLSANTFLFSLGVHFYSLAK